MKKFETLEEYEQVAELNDRIALGSFEINPTYKFEVFAVVDIFREKVTVVNWNSRKNRLLIEEDQEINLISEQEFKKLKR